MKRTLAVLSALLCALGILAGCAAVDAAPESTAPTTAATDGAGQTVRAPTKRSPAPTSGAVSSLTSAATSLRTAPPQTTAGTTAAPPHTGETLAVKDGAVQVLRVPYRQALTAGPGEPLFARRIGSAAELARFCDEQKPLLAAGGEAAQALADYDAEFFADHTLLAVYIGAGSGSYRFGLDRLSLDGGTLHMYVKRTAPQETNGTYSLTADMAGWLLLAELDTAAIGTAAALDARLV